MESIAVSRKRLKNRKRKRQVRKNKRFDRDRLRFEVRSSERQKIIAGSRAYVSKNKLIGKSMDAQAFWENYTTAQRWQQTHNVVWWKSRCLALEEENQILRDTVRKLGQLTDCKCEKAQQVNDIFRSALHNKIPQQFQRKGHTEPQNRNRNKGQNSFQNIEEEVPDDEDHSDNESLEFQVNEGMMDFLQQSIQHKMELKQQREEEEALEMEEEVFPVLRSTLMKQRTENAKLLYGEASPRILGMETALQATIDSHKNKTRPHHWPNIPLKL